MADLPAADSSSGPALPGARSLVRRVFAVLGTRYGSLVLDRPDVSCPGLSSTPTPQRPGPAGVRTCIGVPDVGFPLEAWSTTSRRAAASLPPPGPGQLSSRGRSPTRPSWPSTSSTRCGTCPSEDPRAGARRWLRARRVGQGPGHQASAYRERSPTATSGSSQGIRETSPCGSSWRRSTSH